MTLTLNVCLISSAFRSRIFLHVTTPVLNRIHVCILFEQWEDQEKNHLPAFCTIMETLPMSRRILSAARWISSGTLRPSTQLEWRSGQRDSTHVISTVIATILRCLYFVCNSRYVFWFSASLTSHKQRNAPYLENSTARARPRTPPEPVMRTISSLMDFFGAGKIEKTMARVNLEEHYSDGTERRPIISLTPW